MTAAKKNVVASTLARLRNEANSQGVPFNQVLQLYAIERFLFRLAKSPHAETVLLKGALLLKTYGIPRARPTLDIDLLRRGKADRASLTALIKDCAQIEDATDGITFDATTIVTEDIAKDAEYLGTRVRMAARMSNVRLRVQIDFGIGDAVYPGPQVVEFPTLLGGEPVKLRAYPAEAAVAEKFQAIVELDLANSRMKDFYDIRAYSRNLEFEGARLAKALATTFGKRGTPVPIVLPTGLTAAFFDAPVHVQQWRVFCKRIGETELQDAFAAVIDDVVAFVMPPATAVARGESFTRKWDTKGTWR